jgi:hypothetical protein
LEINNFKPQLAIGVSAAIFSQDVRNLTVINSPLMK